jgi:hypothetical protein
VLSISDLSRELEALAEQASKLAGEVKSNGDLAPKALALGLVETDRLSTRLLKLGAQLAGRPTKRRRK